MIICGLDYSMNSPGVVRAQLDDNLDIEKLTYRGFTSVKKIAKLDDNLLFYHKDKQFKNSFEKSIWMADKILGFMCNCDADGVSNGIVKGIMSVPDYCAMEGYAMGAKGQVFNIGESTMVTKLGIYKNEIALRIYEPSTIKKFATGRGGGKGENKVDKAVMDEYYEMIDVENRIDLSHLPVAKVPKEDLVDAYYSMKLLQTELKLRHGLLDLKSLSLPKIELFNRVTKANPENLLVRPFISAKV